MPQVDNGFILPLEKEIFIDQLKDIVDKAEDMLNEDMEGERVSTLGSSPQQGLTSEGLAGEVRGYIQIQKQFIQMQTQIWAGINKAADVDVADGSVVTQVTFVSVSAESAAWSSSACLPAEWYISFCF